MNLDQFVLAEHGDSRQVVSALDVVWTCARGVQLLADGWRMRIGMLYKFADFGVDVGHVVSLA